MDTTASLDNWLGLARSAELARNNAEAIAYYNRILEVEPRSPEAWLGKGRAAGWLSSLAHLRIEETIVAFGHAIGSADADDQAAIARRAAGDLTAICAGIYNLADQHRRDHPEAASSRATYVSAASHLSDAVERALAWDAACLPAHRLAARIATDLLNLGALDTAKAMLTERRAGAIAASAAADPDYRPPALDAATTVQREADKANSDAIGYIVAVIIMIVGAFIAAANRT